MKVLVLVAGILAVGGWGDCTPCSSVESVDISDGEVHQNGSVLLNGIEFTNRAWYEVDQNGTMVRFGCPCINRICMWKCCGPEQAFYNMSCTNSTLTEVNPFNPPLYSGKEPLAKQAQDTFFYMYGQTCEVRYLVDTNSDQLFLQEVSGRHVVFLNLDKKYC